MREDINNSFDSYIRDILDDASVKAPRSVWKGVAQRIGTDNKARRNPLPWVFAPLAAACAVLFVLWLVPIHPEAAFGTDASLVCLLESESPNPEFERFALAQEIQAVEDLPQINKIAPVLAVAQQFTEESNSADTPEENRTEVQIEEEVAEYIDDWADVFSNLETEEEKAARINEKKGFILNLGTGIGANDAHFSKGYTRPLTSSEALNQDLIEHTKSVYYVPLSFGVDLRYHFANDLSIGIGLNWTQLNREFDGSYLGNEGTFNHILQYVGIPLNVYWDIVSVRSLQLYAFAGASVEKLISNKYYIMKQSRSPLLTKDAAGFMCSAQLGVGAAFRLSNRISLYFDPYVYYYFPSAQPRSIRTEHPLMVSFEAGLRFDL